MQSANASRGQALLSVKPQERGQALLTRRQSGQALLIILLSMAVILTVVLSILSFSTTDIAVTSRTEESLRAFSAAEAGIEEVLLTGSPVIGSKELGQGDLKATYTTELATIAEGKNSFVYPYELPSNDIATIWFVNHNTDGSTFCSGAKPCFTGDRLRFCWGKSSVINSETPAAEISVYYLNAPGDKKTMRVARVSVDPNGPRRSSNKFEDPGSGGCNVDGQNFSFKEGVVFGNVNIPSSSYSVQNGLQFATVRVLYNTNSSEIVGFTVPSNATGGTLTFPSQGTKAVSTGSSGEAKRKVEVSKLYAQVPYIFGSALFSGGDISK